MPFLGIADASEPTFQTLAHLLWDDDYLYVGFDLHDPDVWSRSALRDNDCSKEYAERAFISQGVFTPEWRRLECNIMHMDKFVKVLIDPDNDGENYMEFQINPVNNIFDALYSQGFQEKWGDRERGENVAWTCPGLLTAVHIEGTLNAPHDVDKGWCMEMALPWKALAPFTKGACPPKAGDVWGAHLGRIHKQKTEDPNIYWTWPVIGSLNCHLPSTYGHLVFGDDPKGFTSLMAWGGTGNPEDLVTKAADIGVTDIIAGSRDPKNLAALVEAARKHSIGVYATIMLRPDSWKKKYPGKPVPLQKMNEEENRVLASLQKPDSRRQLIYQWGEEPQQGTEVLIYDLLCFHHLEVKELLKEQIREILSVPGITGVAFDGFGYRNYRCCRCPLSMELFRKQAPDLEAGSEKQALDKFSLDTLVAFNNDLADFARTVKPDARTVNHIWPVFLPDPLYGNRLDIDYCGQTAAWFFPWDLEKVQSRARAIVVDEKAHHPRANGAALIGFYNMPEVFPLKSPECIAAELDAILAGGCTDVQLCSLDDVLRTPEVAAVFRKYFAKQPPP